MVNNIKLTINKFPEIFLNRDLFVANKPNISAAVKDADENNIMPLYSIG